MTVLTDTVVRDRLAAMVAADTDPVLHEWELQDLLAQAVRADAAGTAPDTYRRWHSGIAYALGATVVPAPRNGSVYVVTTAGTSGATQPTWPMGAGATVTDGTVVWTRQGAAPWAYTVDLNAAAAEGWRWKAGKCSNRVDVSEDQQSLHRAQQLAHCLKMADYYARRIGQAVRVPGSLALEAPVVGTEVLAN